jgi:hypothetical protein
MLGAGDERPFAVAGSPPVVGVVGSRLSMVPELEDAILGAI